MRRWNAIGFAMTLLAGLAALSCTKTSPRQPQVSEKSPQGAHDPKNAAPVSAADSNGMAASAPKASVPVNVAASELKSRDLPLTNLTFTVKYAGVERKGPVTVQGNQATMNVAELPTGKTDTFTLSLESNGVAALSGSTPNVALIAGSNTVQVTLRPVTTTPPPSSGDPTKISFARDLKPIFDKNCNECHHPGKSLDLTQYPTANASAVADKVVERATSGNMPPTPRDRLDQGMIQKISQWKLEGLQP